MTRLLLFVIAALAMTTPAAAQTKWTLWRVTDTWPYPSDGGEMPQRLEIPIERDMDRAACELVKQSNVQGLRGSLAIFKPLITADGAVYILEGGLFKDDGKSIAERYLCIAAGKTPAQVSPPRPAIKIGTKWGGRLGGHSQDLSDEQREQFRELNKTRPYCKWVWNGEKWVSECTPVGAPAPTQLIPGACPDGGQWNAEAQACDFYEARPR